MSRTHPPAPSGHDQRLPAGTSTRKARDPGRRWIVAAAVAAVAAAIALPAVYLAGDSSEEPPGGTSAAPTTPPPDLQPGGQAGPGATTYDLLGDVTVGEPAHVPYLERATLVRPDGTRSPLPRDYDQFALLGDRLLGVYDAQGTRVLDVVDASGLVIRATPVEPGFAVTRSGGLAAWTTPAGEVVTMWATGELSFGNQGGPVSVAAVTGGDSCADDGCRVYLNNADGRPPSWVEPDGTVGVVSPGAIKVDDVEPDGTAAVQLSSSPTGSCSGVIREGTGLVWETCDHSLFRFSPDGTYLLASDPYLDGLGLASLSVLRAADGHRIATFRIDGGFIARQTWEDDSHVLVVVSAPDGWEILRLGLDGTRELVAGPLPAIEDPTFTLLVLPGNV